jgi:ubiquinone/menaquinone biosynthesis C-methylase UbiE
MLAKAFPGKRQIIGIDLAQGMVDIANERIEDFSDRVLR